MTASSSSSSAMTRNIPRLKRASCSKRLAAGISNWWKNNALLPFHLRADRGGGHVVAWTARPHLYQAAPLYFPGYGAAIEAATSEGQHLLHEWYQLATAGAWDHRSQHPNPGRGRKGLSIPGFAGEYWLHHGHHEFYRKQSAPHYALKTSARATTLPDQLLALSRRNCRRHGHHQKNRRDGCRGQLARQAYRRNAGRRIISRHHQWPQSDGRV